MSKRFLVVDDSVATRKRLGAFLKKLGHEVVGEAADGIEALEQYNKLKPDVVTMDIQMPEMDGLEATRKLMEENTDTPVIIISAHGQEHTVLQAIEAGAKFFINKPFDEEKIQEVLKKVLGE